jgi:hypothetical protein
MNPLRLVILTCAVCTFSACSTVEAIADFDWNRKGPSPSELRRAQEARDAELGTLQKSMSSAEKKAITETCSKKLTNDMKGGRASLGEMIAAQTDCEITLSK